MDTDGSMLKAWAFLFILKLKNVLMSHMVHNKIIHAVFLQSGNYNQKYFPNISLFDSIQFFLVCYHSFLLNYIRHET